MRGDGTDPRTDARAEIDFHIDMRARELMAEGHSEDEARRRALAAFGDPRRIESAVTRVDEHVRRRRSLRELASSLAHDIRYAARFLKGNPAFTGVVVGTLALGIGATTAIFSLVDAALLRRPPVGDPESLVAVYTSCRAGAPRCTSSYPDYVDYRERTTSLEDLAAATLQRASLGDDERGARLVTVEAATGNYFSLLRLSAMRGRVLQPYDDRLGAGSAVAVLSHGLWRDHFGADPAAVGATIRLNGVPFKVVGVAPEAFRGLALDAAPELWIPLQASAALGVGSVSRPGIWDDRGSRWIGRLVGRLDAGGTVERARDELLAVSEQLRDEDPDARGPRTITVDPLATRLLPAGAEETLPRFVWLLLGVVATTLLLACANLANLLLARASTRSAEMGVRVAIGAGRSRLVRQLLVESLLLAALGGGAGVLLAPLLLRATGSFELPGGVTIGTLGAALDVRTLAAAAALSVLTAVLFGLAPALHASRRDVVATLRSGRSPEGRLGASRLRRTLVAAQVGLCAILLVGSGLFVRSLRSALAVDPGFRTEELAVMRFDLGLLRYSPPELLAFAQALRARALADSRVSAAAVATLVPFQNGGFMGFSSDIEGYQRAPDEEVRMDLVVVSPGYLETLGIPLLDGRELDDGDGDDAAPVAVVNRSMARRYWPNGDAVGGRIRMRDEWVTVVGVADDVRWTGLSGVDCGSGPSCSEPSNFVFVPQAQFTEVAVGPLTLAARTTGDTPGVLASLREQVRSMEPDLSPELLTTMDALVGDVLMPQRLGSALLSAFSLLALALASIGIAGVVSYGVREQRRAIGVRLALGAARGQVVRMVVSSMAAPVVAGLVLGLAAASLLDDVLERFLYGVTPGDPLTYAGIAATLPAVALLAMLLPAREATRIDPLKALRAE
ncbi:MAG: ADOP family duplicated permease [Gemmatimonadales bacterium]